MSNISKIILLFLVLIPILFLNNNFIYPQTNEQIITCYIFIFGGLYNILLDYYLKNKQIVKDKLKYIKY